jgi:hypothetical protein
MCAQPMNPQAIVALVWEIPRVAIPEQGPPRRHRREIPVACVADSQGLYAIKTVRWLGVLARRAFSARPRQNQLVTESKQDMAKRGAASYDDQSAERRGPRAPRHLLRRVTRPTREETAPGGV